MTTSVTAQDLFTAINSALSKQSLSISNFQSGLDSFQKKDYKQAIVRLKAASAFDPYNTDIKNYLAQAYQKVGDTKNAIKTYKEAAQIFKQFASTGTSALTQDDINVSLANLYIDNKDNKNAIEQFKEAIKSNPTNLLAIYSLGQTLVQEGRGAEAETYFNKAKRISPNDGNVYYGLGLAQQLQGKDTEAMQSFVKATSLKKNFAPAIFELGELYFKGGNKDKAQVQLDLLKNIKTDASKTYATLLEAAIKQPKILGIDDKKSTFNTSFGPIPILALDPGLIVPNSSAQLSITFQFDTKMDSNSVTNITNWNIKKSTLLSFDRETGIYNNGLTSSTDTNLSLFPARVEYNQVDNQATIYFNVNQNSTSNGTLDTSKIVFSFKGTDVNGKQMDVTANQISGKSGSAY